MQVSLLEDFVDEEVVDYRGNAVGVLACYWESTTGHLFLGIKPSNQDSIRVVPGADAKIDEHHSCVKVAFNAAAIRSAPVFDCDHELRPRLEQTANEHFAVT